MKEIRLPFEAIKDPQTITDVQERAFQREGLSMHRHEVDALVDDHDKQERILMVKTPRRFFVVPDLPWLRPSAHEPSSKE
jgi:hypothetical protein